MSKVRKMLAFMLIACLVLVVAACSGANNQTSGNGGNGGDGGSNGAGQGGGQSGGAQNPDNVTLTVFLNQSWNKATFEPMMRGYEADNPHVELDLQVIPDNDFSNLLRTRIAAKEVPDVLWYTYGGLIKEINFAEMLVPLDDEPWVGRMANPDAVKFEGKMYGLPSNATGAPIGMIYSKTIFEQLNLNVPTTYEQFLAVCEALKQAGIAPIIAPFKDDWTIGMWHVALFPNVVESDPELTWEKLNRGEVRYADVPGFRDVIGIMQELNEKRYFNDNMMSTTVDMGEQMMADGKAAMILLGDYFIPEVLKINPDVEVGMFPFPNTDDALLVSGNIQMFSIFKDSRHVEESKKLLAYLAEVEQQKQINQDWNNIPAFTDVEIELPYWIEEVIANYIDKGRVPIPQMGLTIPVGVGELAKATQDMLAGGLSPDQVLKVWDDRYEQMARERQLPGWQ